MLHSKQSWVSRACESLWALRGSREGWGYRGDGPAYTEPTVLGCLALLAVADQDESGQTAQQVAASADWLARMQQADGAVGVSEHLPEPKWPTAFAALLWSQLPEFQRPLTRALHWLQQREGSTFTKSEDGVLGHDTTLRGWPWVAGTHSWLEPTGMALLALCRSKLTGHVRVEEGVRLILDRAVSEGGWNMGNSVVFGKSLRPQAGPTGIALLALRAAEHGESSEVTRACQYLVRALPTTRSPETLGWGLLGLSAWRMPSPDAERWLAESFRTAPALSASPSRLAMLILAAAGKSLSLLGVEAVSHETPTCELAPA